MKELRIKYDYSHGPIWKNLYDANTGLWSTGIEIIDKDEKLELLNNEAEKTYSSLYYFDENGKLNFDSKLYEQRKAELSSLMQDIICRIDSINDGSFFVVVDDSAKII